MKRDPKDNLFFNDIYGAPVFDRRKFIKNMGSGIIVVFCLGDIGLLNASGSSSDEDLNFNAYLRVKENGRVDCYTGKIEMGQGIITSLAQVLAEELEVSIYEVDMVMGDTELCPYDRGTWGSLTTRFTDPVIRTAAAEAREVLLGLAEEKLGISKEILAVKEGVVYAKNDPSKKVSYAELTKGQKIVKSLKDKPEIKRSKDFKIIGKPVLSLDAEAKVTGKAKYTADIKLPGMVYAKIVRPKVYGAKKLSVDASGLSKFQGVEFVEIDNLVAVVHEDPEVASKAMKSVKVIWDSSELKVNEDTIFSYLEEQIKESKVFEEGGNLKSGQNNSKEFIKSKYLDGYKAHACIETHAATCYFKGDKLSMWVSTQSPFGTRSQVARALNMPEEKVHVKQIFLGGGFGGKSFNSQAIEAALIASKVRKPVQLSFSRREEFFYNRFRTEAVINVGAGIDAKGKLTAWDFDIYCAGTRGTDLFYEIPNNRTRMFNKRDVHPFNTGAWRAPGNNTTTFARESHIDVMARAAGIDPFEFRITNLKDPNMVATLQSAANTFGWKKEKKSGYGYGIALGHDAGTLVALISEVEVNKQTGEVNVTRVVCAQDMGQVVNPNGATIQTEGGITMGIGYALYEEITFEGGKMKTNNFSNYEFTRFSSTPKISCVFMDRMDAKPQGGGEPAIICVGASIANAVFDACGARVNRMPITPERVLAGIS